MLINGMLTNVVLINGMLIVVNCSRVCRLEVVFFEECVHVLMFVMLLMLLLII